MQTSAKFDRILVGVHPSEDAEDTLTAALTTARRWHAKVDLVCGVELPHPMWIGLEEEQQQALFAGSLADVREQLQGLLEKARSRADFEADPDCLRILPGKAAKVLLHEAEECRADLLFVGPHAKSSLFDFGGTTRAILASATIPVWIQRGPATPIERILVAVDFSEHSEAAIRWAAAAAQRMGASVRVLHSFVPPSFAYTSTIGPTPIPNYVIDQERDAARRELETFVAQRAWKGVEVETVFEENEVVPAILGHQEEADLLVMGTHGQTPFHRFLLGSSAYAAVKRVTRPMVVVPGEPATWLEDGRAREAAIGGEPEVAPA